MENFNGGVDEPIGSGVLRRVLALKELQFSNSLIEAFWPQMKHQWLFLNTLDSVAAVRRHVSTYVAAHNGQIPHSAFRGQTPDEMYFGRGDHVPAKLATASEAAREARLHANRAMTCHDCSCLEAASAGSGVEAACDLIFRGTGARRGNFHSRKPEIEAPGPVLPAVHCAPSPSRS